MSKQSYPTIIYQCYGREDIYEQVFFSVLSLIKSSDWPAEKIILYSDRPEKVRDFFQSRVQVFSLDAQRIKQWSGPLNFVHRVKLEVLRHATKDLSTAMIYADGDTIFLSNPLDLFSAVSSRTSLMHIPEVRLREGKDPLTKKIHKFIRRTTLSEPIPESTLMWNAGIIGLSPENFRLLDRCLNLSDELYGKYQKHIMEQLAVSHVLQTTTEVRAANHLIQHYWDSKPQHLQWISSFLKGNPNWQQALSSFPEVPLNIHPMEKISFWKKVRNKIMKTPENHLA
jgi:hypothetical protein